MTGSLPLRRESYLKLVQNGWDVQIQIPMLHDEANSTSGLWVFGCVRCQAC